MGGQATVDSPAGAGSSENRSTTDRPGGLPDGTVCSDVSVQATVATEAMGTDSVTSSVERMDGQVIAAGQPESNAWQAATDMPPWPVAGPPMSATQPVRDQASESRPTQCIAHLQCQQHRLDLCLPQYWPNPALSVLERGVCSERTLAVCLQSTTWCQQVVDVRRCPLYPWLFLHHSSLPWVRCCPLHLRDCLLDHCKLHPEPELTEIRTWERLGHSSNRCKMIMVFTWYSHRSLYHWTMVQEPVYASTSSHIQCSRDPTGYRPTRRTPGFQDHQGFQHPVKWWKTGTPVRAAAPLILVVSFQQETVTPTTPGHSGKSSQATPPQHEGTGFTPNSDSLPTDHLRHGIFQTSKPCSFRSRPDDGTRSAGGGAGVWERLWGILPSSAAVKRVFPFKCWWSGGVRLGGRDVDRIRWFSIRKVHSEDVAVCHGSTSPQHFCYAEYENIRWVSGNAIVWSTVHTEGQVTVLLTAECARQGALQT